MPRIYLSAPHMGQLEEGFVADAFRTNWLSSIGPNLDAFEASLRAVAGVPAAVALSSGTAAIHLALRLLGVGPGDEVFCPTLTFAASANPIVYQGATPVFLDSDASFNIDPNVLETALAQRAAKGKRPKAILVVHLFGQSADLDPIFEIAARHDVPVIEDAAEALGTLYKGKQVGALGPNGLGIYSFNGNKIITTTGGGALISKNPAWVEKARFWSTQARDPGLSYEHSELGFNYRMSNVLAGIGRGQLAVLEDRVAARRANAFRYRDAFRELEGLTLMPEMPWGRHTYWLSVFLLDEAKLKIRRDDLIHALAKHDIEARPVWKPMHLQKFYGSADRFGGSVAEDLYTRGICLPSSSNLSAEDHALVVARVIAAVRRES